MTRSCVCLIVGVAVAGTGAAHGVTLTVPNVEGGGDNLRVGSIGATTALNTSFGAHVVGPAGAPSGWGRPVVLLEVSDFASLAGLTVTSATLHFTIVSDFTEPLESGASEIRLFTTTETSLGVGNQDVFAGLSGDGGAHTFVSAFNFVDGTTGAQSVPFAPPALTALQAAINGSDPTLAIAFREFDVTGGFASDLLDEFVLGSPPENMSIEVTAEVPEPTTGIILSLLGLVLIRRR